MKWTDFPAAEFTREGLNRWREKKSPPFGNLHDSLLFYFFRSLYSMNKGKIKFYILFRL